MLSRGTAVFPELALAARLLEPSAWAVALMSFAAANSSLFAQTIAQGGVVARFQATVDAAPALGNQVGPVMVPKQGNSSRAIDAGDSYVTRGGLRRLSRLAGAFVLTVNAEADRQKILEQLTGGGGPLEGYKINQLAGQSIALLEAGDDESFRQAGEPGRHRAVLDAVRAAAGVRSANPVFLDPASELWLVPTEEIIVRLRPEIDAAQYFGADWARTRRIPGTTDQYVFTVPGAQAEQLLAEVNRRAAAAEVVWAEPNFVSQQVNYFVPNDTLYPNEWHLANSGQGGGVPGADAETAPAWDFTTGNNSIVAVLDVGTQTSHPDLNPNLAVNNGEVAGNGVDDDGNGYVDDANGWDFFANNNDPNPKTAFDNHGTPVAGVATARGNNGLGIAGTAFMSRLLPVRIGNSSDSSGSFSSSPAIMAQAIYYAAGRTANGLGAWRGADVLNLSFGTSSSQVIDDALTWAAHNGRNGRGCPILVSSGNGASGWTQFTLAGIPSGVHTFRWEYAKDSSVSSGDDTVWLDAVTFPGGPQERFETGGLPAGWSSGGNANWSNVQNGVGNNHALTGWDGPNSRALRAGGIGDSQSSFVETTKSVASGTLSFWAWVSSEPNFDFFNFYFDGVRYFHVAQVPSVAAGVGYPASHPDVMAVGASTDTDYRSDYSQYGAELDFVAPSSGGISGISTTDRTGSAGYNTAAGTAGDYYLSFGGTSSSAPLAAGVAALVLSVHPTLTAAEVRDLLRSTADKIGGVSYVGGFNAFYGYGRINARAAVVSLLPAVASITRLNPASQVTAAASVTYRVIFNENVNNVSVNDFTPAVVSGTITGASVASVSAASGTTIDVTVNTGSGSGDLRLDLIVPGATITDDFGNNVVTSFTSGQVYTIQPALIFADDFNRANGSSLGANWSELAGDMSIANNQLAASSQLSLAAVTAFTAQADVALQAHIDLGSTGVGYAGLVARVAGDSFYWGTIVNNNGVFTAAIYRYQAGVFTLLGSNPSPGGSGTLRFILVGSSLRLYFNDALLRAVTDGALASSGSVGVLGQSCAFDDFAASPSIVTKPFSDDFNRADGTFIGSVWFESAGDSVLSAGQVIAGSGGLSLVVLNGSTAADHTNEADVNVAGSGVHYAGLVARASSSGFYWGTLINNNGQFIAGIYRYSAGVFTPLASSPVPGASGRLKFQVSGNSLVVSFNNVAVAGATDNALSTPGLAGLLGLGGAYDNYEWH